MFFPLVANLAKPGTFAGNDAIVAFARNNQMNVVIHQVNAPLWKVRNKTSAFWPDFLLRNINSVDLLKKSTRCNDLGTVQSCAWFLKRGNT